MYFKIVHIFVRWISSISQALNTIYNVLIIPRFMSVAQTPPLGSDCRSDGSTRRSYRCYHFKSLQWTIWICFLLSQNLEMCSFLCLSHLRQRHPQSLVKFFWVILDPHCRFPIRSVCRWAAFPSKIRVHSTPPARPPLCSKPMSSPTCMTVQIFTPTLGVVFFMDY